MIKVHTYFINLFLISIFFSFPSCANNKKAVTMGTMLQDKRNVPQIKLYVYHTCPYCKKVIQYLKTSGNEQKVEIVDASRPENLQELKRLNNNNTQCPFLYDLEQNIKMLESMDIIAYLKKRL